MSTNLQCVRCVSYNVEYLVCDICDVCSTCSECDTCSTCSECDACDDVSERMFRAYIASRHCRWCMRLQARMQGFWSIDQGNVHVCSSSKLCPRQGSPNPV